nr:MAG TPA: hypothetical protein [Caudoviricetes sp.]
MLKLIGIAVDNLTGPICGKHLLLGGVFYFSVV